MQISTKSVFVIFLALVFLSFVAGIYVYHQAWDKGGEHSEDNVRTMEFIKSVESSNDLAKRFYCLAQNKKALIVSHRGGLLDKYPENTMLAFDEINKKIPTIIEVDVRATSDGVYFLHHDKTLERTTNGSGLVIDTTWSEVEQLKLRRNDGVLTHFSPVILNNALSWANGTAMLMLDVKPPTDILGVANLVSEESSFSNVIFIAYSPEDALKLQKAHEDAAIALGIEDEAALSRAEALGLKLEKIYALTNDDRPRSSFYRQLLMRNIIPIFTGQKGEPSYDDRLMNEPDSHLFGDVALAGAPLIVSDYPVEAHASLTRSGNSFESGDKCAYFSQ